MGNNEQVESILLKIVYELNERGNKIFQERGTESYVDRCNNHDAKMLIYKQTNKYATEQKSFNKKITEIKNNG